MAIPTKEEIKKAYPVFSSLTEQEKRIVINIAMQIPLSCEDVATIFIHEDSNRKKTVDYIYKNYRFIVN